MTTDDYYDRHIMRAQVDGTDDRAWPPDGMGVEGNDDAGWWWGTNPPDEGFDTSEEAIAAAWAFRDAIYARGRADGIAAERAAVMTSLHTRAKEDRDQARAMEAEAMRRFLFSRADDCDIFAAQFEQGDHHPEHATALTDALDRARLGERTRIAAAESVSCRYAHEPPGTGDDRPKVVLVVRDANGRRESIILSPETLYVDDRDRLAAAKEEGRAEQSAAWRKEMEHVLPAREREAGAAALRDAAVECDRRRGVFMADMQGGCSVGDMLRERADSFLASRATDTRGGGE